MVRDADFYYFQNLCQNLFFRNEFIYFLFDKVIRAMIPHYHSLPQLRGGALSNLNHAWQ